MIELKLPYPISTNDYWASHVPKGSKIAYVYVTALAVKYKRDVGWIAKAAGLRVPTLNPVSIALVLHPKKFDKNGKKLGATMDLGNCWKVAEDALQGIAFVNDKQIKHIQMDYGAKTDAGALVVQITELDLPQVELFPAPRLDLQVTAAKQQPEGNPF